MELTPRTDESTTAPGAGRRRALGVLGIVLVLGAVGLVLVQALGDATVFFRNADEAVAERAELGDRRFRLQGTVVDGSVVETTTGVEFTVAYGDAAVDVHHTGAPVELFQECVPVVLEGAWHDDVYESDWMAVKHTEVYVEENEDRLDDAGQGCPPASYES